MYLQSMYICINFSVLVAKLVTTTHFKYYTGNVTSANDENNTIYKQKTIEKHEIIRYKMWGVEMILRRQQNAMVELPN